MSSPATRSKRSKKPRPLRVKARKPDVRAPDRLTREEIAAAERDLQTAIRRRQAGELNHARAICKKLLTRHPDYVGALYTLGMTHIDERDYAGALPCLIQAAMYDPEDFRIMTNLAGVYLQLGASEMAALTYEKALALKSDVPEIHYNLGKIYEERREYERAAASFATALELRPRPAAARYLGDCLRHLGRLEEAGEALGRAHALDPFDLGTLVQLAYLPRACVDVDRLAAIDAALAVPPDQDADMLADVGLARARALHELGRHEAAWAQAIEANGMVAADHAKLYRRDQGPQAYLLEWAANCSPDLVGDVAADERAPVSLFFVGPSRSGKTSLERLLGEVEGVRRGYENRIIANIVERTNQGAGRLTLNMLGELPDHLRGAFASSYAAEIELRAPGAKVFTNTLPGTIADVAWIAVSVPNARFVFVERDWHDLALRMFFTRYRQRNHHAYDLANIRDYLAWYYGMADIWCGTFAPIATKVAFDALCRDPAATRAHLAQLCGLEPPRGPVPRLGNDLGCGAPYRQWIDTAWDKAQQDG